MQFTPYLQFNGDCAEAFAFYAALFGGKIVHQSTFGESPGCEGLPEEARKGIMHVHLQIGSQSLMASDCVPGAACGEPGGYCAPQGMWISIGMADEAEGRRVFDGLARGGRIAMPFGKTFWSPAFGMVTDRFGTPWMVNVASPQPLAAG